MENTELKVYNGTPHQINIISGATLDSTDRKWKGGELILSIPSDGMLNAKIETIEVSSIGKIPMFDKKIVGCDALPSGYDIYIVSQLFSVAYKGDRKGLYTVADPVMSDDGTKFIGCRGLQKA